MGNIGTGTGVSTREFVEACKHVTGRPIRVNMRRETRPGDYAQVYADPAKANRELEWEAQFKNITEGLMTAWRWRMRHPHGYEPIANSTSRQRGRQRHAQRSPGPGLGPRIRTD